MENPGAAETTDLATRLRKLEEQNYELEKQLRAKDAVAKKDKAVYEQKIALLELQIRESKERYVVVERWESCMRKEITGKRMRKNCMQQCCLY